MNLSDYTYLLNKPDAVSDKQTLELEKIVNEFPYFQSARALRLKGLYNQNSFQYNYALKVTAAHTTDRSVLFDFITSDTFTAIHKGLYDKKLAELFNIEVRESEEVIGYLTPPDNSIGKVEQSILTSIRESEIPYDKEVFYDEVSSETENDIDSDEITDPDESELEIIDSAELEEATFGIDPHIYEPEPEIVEEETADDPFDTLDQELDLNIFNERSEIPIEDSDINDDKEDDEEIIHDLTGSSDAPPDDRFKELADAETTAQEHVISMVRKDDESEEITASAEDKLEIGKPLPFSPDEKHSFQEWLQLSRLKPIDRDEKPEEIITLESDEKVKKNVIIERFIEANPKIPPVKSDARPMNFSEPADDNAALMTETLARVYLEQKKYTKAIQAYEILILKYPEKSSFFADRISEIKNLQQNNLLQ